MTESQPLNSHHYAAAKDCRELQAVDEAARELEANLDPVECPGPGSPAEVTTAARAAIAAGGQGAFILGSGCEVRVASPQENLRAMIEVVKQ